MQSFAKLFAQARIMEVREYENDGASGNGNSGIVKKEDKNDLNNNDDSEGR